MIKSIKQLKEAINNDYKDTSLKFDYIYNKYNSIKLKLKINNILLYKYNNINYDEFFDYVNSICYILIEFDKLNKEYKEGIDIIKEQNKKIDYLNNIINVLIQSKENQASKKTKKI